MDDHSQPSPMSALPTFGEAKSILLKGGTIISMDKVVGNLHVGDILVRGTKIEAVGSNIEAEASEVIDARGMIVIPGMVDAHRHAWEGQLRRINPNSATLEDYCNATHFSYGSAYRPFDIYVGNLITALGCIDSGITTIIDNSHNSRTDAHSDAAIQALVDVGIRAIHAAGAPVSGEWDQEGWPRHRMTRLKEKYFKTNDQLVTLAVMFQIDRAAWRFARELGLPIVTEFLGPGMTAELKALRADGLLGPDNIFNHCTGLPDWAWEVIKEAGIGVNVCPRSDAQYGMIEGMFGYAAAMRHDTNPAFSVDNETSYGGDMFGEMKIAFYLQRAATQASRYHGAPAPAPALVADILKAATLNGAICAGLDKRIGSITAGKEADIVLIRANDLNLYPSGNAVGTVVLAAERGNVDTVIVAGRILKRHGKMAYLDFDALKRITQESREHLFSAVGYWPGQFGEIHSELCNCAAPPGFREIMRAFSSAVS